MGEHEKDAAVCEGIMAKLRAKGGAKLEELQSEIRAVYGFENFRDFGWG